MCSAGPFVLPERSLAPRLGHSLAGDQCLQTATYACQFAYKSNSVYCVEPLLLCGANYDCTDALGAS